MYENKIKIYATFNKNKKKIQYLRFNLILINCFY